MQLNFGIDNLEVVIVERSVTVEVLHIALELLPWVLVVVIGRVSVQGDQFFGFHVSIEFLRILLVVIKLVLLALVIWLVIVDVVILSEVTRTAVFVTLFVLVAIFLHVFLLLLIVLTYLGLVLLVKLIQLIALG